MNVWGDECRGDECRTIGKMPPVRFALILGWSRSGWATDTAAFWMPDVSSRLLHTNSQIVTFYDKSTVRAQNKFGNAKNLFCRICIELLKWNPCSLIQSVIISREGLILTLSILPCLQGRIFWSTPCRNIARGTTDPGYNLSYFSS